LLNFVGLQTIDEDFQRSAQWTSAERNYRLPEDTIRWKCDWFFNMSHDYMTKQEHARFKSSSNNFNEPIVTMHIITITTSFCN